MIAPTHAKRYRPNMPDYGITSTPTDGMLTWEWFDEQMEQSRNYWICTTRPNGHPHAAPVWGVWVEGALYFGTGETSVKYKNIQHNNHAVVHLESGDKTVIIEGQIVPAVVTKDTREKVRQAYVKKYKHDPEQGDADAVWYTINPHKIMTWLENDFLNSVAYWDFDEGR